MSQKKPKVSVDRIDAVLPQTQCGLCNYDGCEPYAQAMVDGTDTIDHCHPGGEATLNDLAQLLDIDASPYIETVNSQYKPPAVVRIREDECIGCTKCISACPVDAIIGAAKQMHVVVEKDCNGCELCIEPCPMDCIDIITLKEKTEAEKHFDRERNRIRYQAHQQRLERVAKEKREKHLALKNKKDNARETVDARKQAIQAALLRVKKKS